MKERFAASDDARLMTRLSLSAILLVLGGLGILMLDGQHKTAPAVPNSMISRGN
jgi:hypothetical protein